MLGYISKKVKTQAIEQKQFLYLNIKTENTYQHSHHMAMKNLEKKRNLL